MAFIESGSRGDIFLALIFLSLLFFQGLRVLWRWVGGGHWWRKEEARWLWFYMAWWDMLHARFFLKINKMKNKLTAKTRGTIKMFLFAMTERHAEKSLLLRTKGADAFHTI